MEARFEAVQPALLGALLTCSSRCWRCPAWRLHPDIGPAWPTSRRWARWCSVHGEPAGAFLARYHDMRKDGVLRTIDSSPVGAGAGRLPGGRGQRLQWHAVGTTGPAGTIPAARRSLAAIPEGAGDALRRLGTRAAPDRVECRNLPKIGGVIRWHIFSKPQPADLMSRKSCKVPARPATATPRPAGSSAAAGHAGHAGRGVAGEVPEKVCPRPATACRPTTARSSDGVPELLHHLRGAGLVLTLTPAGGLHVAPRNLR